MPWSLYIIRCQKGTFYTGITTAVERRLAQHRGKNLKGAKYLRGRGALELVYQYPIGEKGLALKVEHAIKRLPKLDKLRLIAGKISMPSIIERILI